VHVMGHDDVYPVKTFKFGLLHYFIAELTPDDGRRKRPKHVE